MNKVFVAIFEAAYSKFDFVQLQLFNKEITKFIFIPTVQNKTFLIEKHLDQLNSVIKKRNRKNEIFNGWFIKGININELMICLLFKSRNTEKPIIC